MTARRPDRPTTADLPGLLAASRLREPPRDVLQRAIALSSRLPQPAPSLAFWLVTLLFDSALQPAPAGLRSAGSAERRVLYEARPGGQGGSSHQIDLRLRREPGGSVEILGQCLPPMAAATVEVRSGRTRHEAAVDDAGEFLVRGVQARGAALALTLVVAGKAALVIDELPLPDPPASR